MAEAGPSSSAASAELATADEKFQQAKSLRRSEPEQAIRLFGEALELRVKHHGDTSIHCASAYLEVRPRFSPVSVREDNVMPRDQQCPG
jgi:hypothetical protein